jgi:hypothetical protein
LPSPVKVNTDSGGKRTPVPVQSERPRRNVAGRSCGQVTLCEPSPSRERVARNPPPTTAC